MKEGGGILLKKGDAVSLAISCSWRVVNVTTVTFKYILVKVSLFPLNVDVNPCSRGTVIVFV